MPTEHWPVYSPFAKEHFGRGKAEGRARAILIVLDAQGFEVPEDARARVGECTDLEQLDVWLRRAAVAASIDDVFLNG
ncbi:hypothetical protein [Actinoallomurus sp. CA-150999]|uniref:hypothetical protein n=1 Tax=Actinoallomurus sp. CA-150999 TaxID=3239887 RepID=UPI003D93F20C